MSLNARTTKEEEAARLEELKALEEQGGSEGYKAALVVCVNTNICGKANPTPRPGYGFAFMQLRALRHVKLQLARPSALCAVYAAPPAPRVRLLPPAFASDRARARRHC